MDDSKHKTMNFVLVRTCSSWIDIRMLASIHTTSNELFTITHYSCMNTTTNS